MVEGEKEMLSITKKVLPDTDRTFMTLNYLILGLVLLVVLYPLYFIIIASISEPSAVYEGKVLLFPEGLTVEGYKRIFSDATILTGYKNSIIYTVTGTFISVLLTSAASYSLSRKELAGRKIILFLLTLTMFFQGGIIPTFLVVNKLGLMNTIWAIVLPSAVWVYNIFIMRTFFSSSIPVSLYEAAVLDGCSQFRYFFTILLPLSKAVLSVMILFYGIALWNMFFQPLIYLSEESKFPLQLILRNILLESDIQGGATIDADTVAKRFRVSELLKYSAIIVAAVPPLLLYPFLQKHFSQGVLIGSVKG